MLAACIVTVFCDLPGGSLADEPCAGFTCSGLSFRGRPKRTPCPWSRRTGLGAFLMRSRLTWRSPQTDHDQLASMACCFAETIALSAAGAVILDRLCETY